MDWLYIPDIEDESAEAEYMLEMIYEFVTENEKDISEYLKDLFEDNDETLNTECAERLLRYFMIFLNKKKGRHDGVSYNPTN